jgi:hypothetical protein
MLQYKVLGTLQHFLSDSSVLVSIVSIIKNLCIITEAKTLVRESGLLTVLLDLLVTCCGGTPHQYIEQHNEPGFDLLLSDSQKNTPPPPPPSIIPEIDPSISFELTEQVLGALVTLSFSEANRQIITQNSSALQIISEIVSKYSEQYDEKRQTQLLKNTIALIDNLLFYATCREYFHACKILRPLFKLLLVAASSQELTSQILSLVQKLTVDERNNDIVKDEGMMPLVSSMSHPNEYVVTQALLVIINLTRFDSSRKMVSTYMDMSVLDELSKHMTNVTIQQLSKLIKHTLGL